MDETIRRETMKRTLTLTVDYDDEAEGRSVTQSDKGVGFLSSHITVRKEPLINGAKFDGKSVLAHEMGHVIGQLLDLPGHQRFERAYDKLRPVIENNLQDNGAEKVMANLTLARPKLHMELEAWNMANKMDGIMLSREAQEGALETYQVTARLQRFWEEGNREEYKRELKALSKKCLDNGVPF